MKLSPADISKATVNVCEFLRANASNLTPRENDEALGALIGLHSEDSHVRAACWAVTTQYGN